MNKFPTLFLILSLSLFSLGCGKKTELVTFDKTQGDYNQFINQKPLPSNPNLSLDKSIINNEYPVEIALYSDGKFFYSLDNLGTGIGTYFYDNGVLSLSADRNILGVKIKMKYTFDITKKDGSESVLKFSDRWGPQVFPTKLTQ